MSCSEMPSERPTRRTSSLKSRRSGSTIRRFIFGQAAHVVVRLDRGRGAVHRAGLDHVGVDRALRQPAHVGELLRLLVEHLHEVAADDLALCARGRSRPPGRPGTSRRHSRP